VSDRPILFSGPMVRRILDGSKTQTRRLVDTKRGLFLPSTKHTEMAVVDGRTVARFETPWEDVVRDWDEKPPVDWKVSRCGIYCPYGSPGDRLWVRETWAAPHPFDAAKPSEIPAGTRIHYAADAGLGGPRGLGGLRGRPAIFCMPWMSRIMLLIVSVRVERLQDISEHDSIAEGVSDWVYDTRCETARDGYRVLWDSINAKRVPWAANPWVWVIEWPRFTP